MPDINVNKKIRHLEDTDLGNRTYMEGFITACKKEWKPKSFEQKPIVIKKPDNIQGLFTTLDPKLLRSKDLSFDISEEDVVKIYHEIIAITTDPLSVASLLKELDTELGVELQKNNIQFSENDHPQFLITGKGNYIPGPPPDDYKPKRKQRVLDALLSEREQKNEINKEGVPKFVGFVESKDADSLVASGYVFTEDKQVSRLLLHGSLSHRLMFDALCCAVKTGKLNLQYEDGGRKELTPQQLIELLVRTNYYQRFQDRALNRNPISLWTLTLDTVVDTTNTSNNFFDPDQYNFSCRSPFVLNSLLLCFGKELGLSNLEHCLLDSHWKAGYGMVYRVKDSKLADGIPDGRIYTSSMEALSTAEGHPGVIDMKFPFTLTESDAQANPTYEPFNSTSPAGIVKKSSTSGSTGEYASWNEFFDRQKQKQSALAEVPEARVEIPASTAPKEKQPQVTAKPEVQPTTKLTTEIEGQTTQPQFGRFFAGEEQSPPKTVSILKTYINPWERIEKSIERNSRTELEEALNYFKPSLPSLIVDIYNHAIKNHAYQCLYVLVAYGLDINAIGWDNKTALMVAKENSDSLGVMMLENLGAKESLAPNSDVKMLEEIKQAIDQNSPTVLKAALDKFTPSSASHIVDLYKRAIGKHAYECLDVLVESGLNVNAVDQDNNNNKTALMIAKENRDYQAMLMLVKAGANLSPKPNSTYSAAALMTSHGIHKSTPPSIVATEILKQLREGISYMSDDKLFVSDMEYQLTKKSSNQQLAIILLDYVERKKLILSPTMETTIGKVIDSLLSENLTASVKPNRK